MLYISVSSGEQSQGSKYKAIYPFEARNPDELTLDPGDIIWVRIYFRLAECKFNFDA